MKMEKEVKNITNTIMENAEKTAASIIEEAKTQGETLVEMKKREAIQFAEKEAVRFQERLVEAKLVRQKIIADAKSKAQWEILSEKQSLVEQIFTSLNGELNAYVKSPDYERMLGDLLVSAGIVLKGGELTITLNNEDISRVNIDDLAEKISKQTNVQTTLILSDEKHDDFGVILKTSNGKIVIDNTYKSILKRMEQNLRYKAVQILFN